MISDLAIARLAFAQSSNSVEGMVRTARLQLQLQAVHGIAEDRAAVGLQPTTPLDTIVDGVAAGAERVDRKA